MAWKCSVCGMDMTGDKYGTGSNNALPVNKGRCCNGCNEVVVLPMRIRRIAATGKW